MSKQIALSNPTFDYSQISEEAKGKLICYESELSRSRNRAAIELIKHGEILHGVQEVLADYSSGVFVAWLDSVGFSTSSAYRAITAYVEYGSFPNLGNLEVSAMYELTKNEAAKKKAMKLADKGTIVTHAMAKQLIESASPKPKPKPKPAPEPEPDEQDDEPEEGYDEPPWDDSPKKAKAPKTPPRQFDRSHWLKQWDNSIGPLVRLVDKIAENVGESQGKSHRAVQSQLQAATEEIMEWMGK